MEKTFDYIIAGGGSAGCTLASRLCENKDINVLLIEAGGSGKSLFTQMPGGNGYIFGNPKFDWCLESIPQPQLNNRKILYPRGKGLGGSSLLNGMIYMRGAPGDFNRWRQKGLNEIWKEYKEFIARYLPQGLNNFLFSPKFEKIMFIYLAIFLVVLVLVLNGYFKFL